jgi:hypothetical protein
MEVARLVLDYLKVFVWPATTLSIVYGFRGQLSDLIRRVKLLSAPGIDAEFSAEVIEASEEAEAVLITNRPTTDNVPDRPGDATSGRINAQAQMQVAEPYDMLLSYADLQPEAAVVAAWWPVQAEIRRLEQAELGTNPKRVWPTSTALQVLSLPPDIKESLWELDGVYSRVFGTRTSPTRVSPEAARAYIRSCREMVAWLHHHQPQQPLS